MNLKRLVSSDFGVKMLSIILGLGLATLFRKVCKGRNCMVFKGPPMKEVEKTIYTEKVIPLVQTIRELKYKYIDLEYDSDENVYYLNAKHYLIRDLETNTLEEDEPRLLSNIK